MDAGLLVTAIVVPYSSGLAIVVSYLCVLSSLFFGFLFHISLDIFFRFILGLKLESHGALGI